MKTSFLCVIPARLQSTRFPRKVLHPIAGLPMLVHVYRRAQESACFSKILVATDSEEVQEVCKLYKIDSLLTSPHHASGFDRVVEVAERNPHFSHYLNLQGDEPCVHPQTIGMLVEYQKAAYRQNKEKAKIVTAAVAFTRAEDFQNPNQVKVVFDKNHKALYFSRSPLPYFREQQPLQKTAAYKHQGIYAYEKETLLQLARLPSSALEQAELLEQLRFLEAGFAIDVVVTPHNSIGVDSSDDIEKVLPQLQQL